MRWLILANNEESFFNILGQEISRSLIVQQMIDYYYEKLELGETSVTDFNEGSEIRNLLESIAVDLYDLMEDNYEVSKISFIPTAYGEWLDAHGANPLIDLPRNQGTEAVGVVTFSIPSSSSTDTIIADGTVIVSNETNLQYATDGDCIIPAGTTSNDVFVSCLTVGTDGNSSANTLTIIDDNNIDSSVSVTNNESIIGGIDYEDDEPYRQRLLDFVRKDDFGSVGYYTDLGNNIEGVHDIILQDTSSNPITVVVNGNNKPVENYVMANVLAEFTDTNNIVIGHNFTVTKVNYTEIGDNFTVNITTEQEIATADIKNLLTIIFNGGVSGNNYTFEGLLIGESLSYDTLVTAFENEFDALTTVNFKLSNASFTSLNPTDDDYVLQIIVDDITINQVINEG